MRIRISLPILIVVTCFHTVVIAQNRDVNKAVIEFEIRKGLPGKEYKIVGADISEIETGIDGFTEKFIEKDNLLKCTLPINKPVSIYSSAKEVSTLPYLNIDGFPLEPGDSIHIKEVAGELIFSGTGYAKLEMLHAITKKINQDSLTLLKDSKHRYFSLKSLPDYLAYSNYLTAAYQVQLNMLKQYEKKISRYSFLYLYGYFLQEARYSIAAKFSVLMTNRNEQGLKNDDLVRIFDSTLKGFAFSALEKLDATNHGPVERGLRKYAELSYSRSVGFTKEKDNQHTRHLQYAHAKSIYSGLAQRKALLAILRGRILRVSVGIKAGDIAIAEEFIKTPGYPAGSQYMKNFLERQLALQKGRQAPAFSLTGINDQSLSLDSLEGKVVFMDFWFTGCTGCVQMTQALKNVEKAFHHNKHVEFLSISTDASKTQWVNSIAKGKYTTGTATNLYTDGKGRDHAIIKDYNITAYPAIFLVDAAGKFVRPVPDPRDDNGRALIAVIKSLLPPSAKDGPYLLYRDNKKIIKSIELDEEENPVAKEEELPEKQTLRVGTDTKEKFFEVKLKEQLRPEPVHYSKPSGIFVASDMEGNFYAFREVLQANKIIDENFNWTFGNGHLVLTGDFVDRGAQVTELLWLIYSLEEKAKAAGGYVHFILGNHEVMNLHGDIRYAQKKYKDNAILLNEDYSFGLYGTHSELGRWLRTKNIMEKIGDLLFAHGGISAEVNRLPLSLEEINTMVRPFYGKKNIDSTNRALSTLYDSKMGENNYTSPFWSRSYYEGKKLKEEQVDTTLSKFNVRRIITGHTIIADTISVHYNGKVINTDTKHSEGKTEALLIEGDHYYRVNAEGKKALLFTDDKRNSQ